MENPAHTAMVTDLYTAFKKGDTEALLACFSDDVIFTVPEMPDVPLRPEYSGKDGIMAFLKDREPVIRYTAFEPRKFFSDQDTVLVIGETAGEVLTTRTLFGYKWVQLFEFDSAGRIRRFHEFLDTQVLVSAFRAAPQKSS